MPDSRAERRPLEGRFVSLAILLTWLVSLPSVAHSEPVGSLRYRYVAGESTLYGLTLLQEGTVRIHGVSETVSTRITGQLVLTASSLSPEGGAALTVRLHDVAVERRIADRVLAGDEMAASLMAQPMSWVVDGRGVTQQLSIGGRGSVVAMRVVEDTVLRSFPVFPERPLDGVEPWTEEARAPEGAPIDTVVTRTWQLGAIEGGERAMRGAVTVSLSGGGPGGAVVRGTSQGTSGARFDVAAGQLDSLTVESKLEVAGTRDGVEVMGQRMTTRVELRRVRPGRSEAD